MKKITSLLSPYRGLPREIYFLFASKVITAMGAYVFPLMTLILTDKIGLNTKEAGSVISIAGLIYIPASLLAGKLADTYGRKKMMVLFETLSALVYIVCAFINPNMNLVYLIVLAGMLSVMSHPAQDAMIADYTVPKNRSSAFALTYLGFNLGFAIGPIIGGILFRQYLNLVFIGDAITTLISVILIVVFVKEHDSNKKINNEKTLLKKSTFRVLIEKPILLTVGIILCSYGFVYAQWSFLLPHHVNTVYPIVGARLYGTMASFNGIVVILFTPLVTKFLEKARNVIKMAIGGILYAVGFGILGFMENKAIFFMAVFIFTVGEIAVSISNMPFIQNHTPDSHRGRMGSIMGMIIQIGFIFGPIGIGAISEAKSIQAGWYVVLIVAAIGSGLMLVAAKKDRGEKVE